MKTVDKANIERLLKNFKSFIEDEKTFNSDKWKKLNDKYSPTKKDHFILENFNSLLKALPKARGLNISIDSIFNKQSLISFLEKPNILSQVNDNTYPRDQELQGILSLLNDILKNNINYEGFCFVLFADSYSKIQNKEIKVFLERWNADLFKSFRGIYKESTELSDEALTYILSWYLLDATTKKWVKPIDFAKSSPKKSCSFCNELIEATSTTCYYCKIDESNSQCPECHAKIEKATKVCPNCNLKFSDYKKIEELNKDLFDFKRALDWKNVIIVAEDLLKYFAENPNKIEEYNAEIDYAKTKIEEEKKELEEQNRLVKELEQKKKKSKIIKAAAIAGTSVSVFMGAILFVSIKNENDRIAFQENLKAIEKENEQLETYAREYKDVYDIYIQARNEIHSVNENLEALNFEPNIEKSDFYITNPSEIYTKIKNTLTDKGIEFKKIDNAFEQLKLDFKDIIYKTESIYAINQNQNSIKNKIKELSYQDFQKLQELKNALSDFNKKLGSFEVVSQDTDFLLKNSNMDSFKLFNFYKEEKEKVDKDYAFVNKQLELYKQANSNWEKALKNSDISFINSNIYTLPVSNISSSLSSLKSEILSIKESMGKEKSIIPPQIAEFNVKFEALKSKSFSIYNEFEALKNSYNIKDFNYGDVGFKQKISREKFEFLNQAEKYTKTFKEECVSLSKLKNVIEVESKSIISNPSDYIDRSKNKALKLLEDFKLGFKSDKEALLNELKKLLKPLDEISNADNSYIWLGNNIGYSNRGEAKRFSSIKSTNISDKLSLDEKAILENALSKFTSNDIKNPPKVLNIVLDNSKCLDDIEIFLALNFYAKALKQYIYENISYVNEIKKLNSELKSNILENKYFLKEEKNIVIKDNYKADDISNLGLGVNLIYTKEISSKTALFSYFDSPKSNEFIKSQLDMEKLKDSNRFKIPYTTLSKMPEGYNSVIVEYFVKLDFGKEFIFKPGYYSDLNGDFWAGSKESYIKAPNGNVYFLSPSSIMDNQRLTSMADGFVKIYTVFTRRDLRNPFYFGVNILTYDEWHNNKNGKISNLYFKQK